MQVLIRRKGVSLRAEWDGLAKPTDKQLHYWLRPTPDAPVVNAQTTRPVTDVLTASVIGSGGIGSVAVQTSQSATVVLFRGTTGKLERPLSAPVLGSTTITDANAVIVNYAAGPMANAQVTKATVAHYSVNLLRIVSVAEHVAPKLVEPTKHTGHEVVRFAGHDFAHCYQVAVNQMIGVVEYRLNLFSVDVSNVYQKTLPSAVVARDDVVVLEAPLPSGELLRANATSYDYAPAPTDPNHMELVTQVDDPLAHTHWSRTPKPTHFVQESQVAVGSEELVRGTTPVGIVQAGKWSKPVIYSEGSLIVTDEGVGAGVRPRGLRSAISLTHTNGLGRYNFTQNATFATYSVRVSYKYYSRIKYRYETRSYPAAYAYEVFSGAHTDPNAALVNYDGIWNANGNSGNWVQLDFGKVVHGIDGLVTKGDGGDRHMKGIQILVSEDSAGSWRVHATVYTSSKYGLDTFDLVPFSARYVRLQNISNWGDADTSLRGAELLKRS